VNSDQYCREIEAYLCRKNDGHLVRIVGPSFERVSAWAARGVPVKIAFRGIDRYFERYYAKGPKRRPVRIDFCEADVLDVFDEWRRAVGVQVQAAGQSQSDPGDSGRKAGASVPAHLLRVMLRLTDLRLRADLSAEFRDVLDRLAQEVDQVRASGRSWRGAARERVLARLAELDDELIHALRRESSPRAAALREEAEAELAPFRERMAREAFERALQAAIDRLLRESWGLPRITL
jgi:hypothetical protein